MFAIAFVLFCPIGNASIAIGPASLGNPGQYDYSPSVIQTGNLQEFWWCGYGVNPNDPNQLSDTIYYYSYNLSTHATVGPKIVLGETPGTWDAQYTCNPKVIKGVFANPLGNGQNYTYAMYYVATDNFPADPNSIGVAFSNDGMSWAKYPNPVIAYTAQDKQNGWYGVGQPAVYNSNGTSAITVFYEGHESQAHYEATSTDGIHFTTVGTLTTNGLSQVDIAGLSSPAPASWGDMAYDSQTGYWYAVFNMYVRPPSRTGGVTERGQPGAVVYRIPNADLLTGTIPWQQVFTVDTNLTGFESNFIPGFIRDGNGTVNVSGYYPNIAMYTSVSSPRPAWNATPTQRANSGGTGNWNINWEIWTPNTPLAHLQRYYNSSAFIHEVTTGYVDTTCRMSTSPWTAR